MNQTTSYYTPLIFDTDSQGWVVTKYCYFVTVLRYFSEYFLLVMSYNCMLYFYFYFRYFFQLFFYYVMSYFLPESTLHNK